MSIVEMNPGTPQMQVLDLDYQFMVRSFLSITSIIDAYEPTIKFELHFYRASFSGERDKLFWRRSVQELSSSEVLCIRPTGACVAGLHLFIILAMINIKERF